MSPEQHAGGETSAASDQFSFCVALWEALLGVRPFAGERYAELSAAVQEGRLSTPKSVPPLILQALRRGLAVDPEDRFVSMRELLNALRPPPRPFWRRAPADDHVSKLPYAVAWRERSPEGLDVVRIHFQSHEISCGDVGHPALAGEATVRVLAPYVAGTVDLGPLDAVAVIGADGPGNPDSVTMLAFLAGELSLDVLDKTKVGGLLRVDGFPFEGCFEARICPEPS